MRISAGLKGFSGKIKRNARARGLITAFPKARPNASLHYCGKSTRTCQNHVRPHPHQARPYQPNKGDARHGRGAPCRSWHLPALETYLHGRFLFFFCLLRQTILWKRIKHQRSLQRLTMKKRDGWLPYRIFAENPFTCLFVN